MAPAIYLIHTPSLRPPYAVFIANSLQSSLPGHAAPAALLCAVALSLTSLLAHAETAPASEKNIPLFYALPISANSIGNAGSFFTTGSSSNLGAEYQTKPDKPLPEPSAAAATNRGFLTRLGHAYLNDWTVDSNGLPPAREAKRRGFPAPLNSPPFPSADWPIGGTVVIGAPDYQTYPWMQAANENKSRIKVYGWFDIGGNAGTSNKGKYAKSKQEASDAHHTAAARQKA